MSRQGRVLSYALMLALVIMASALLPTEYKAALQLQGALHPWMHVIAFACISILIMSNLSSRPARLVGLVVLLVFGWATEYGEHAVSEAPFEVLDVLADSVGVVVGYMLALLRSGAM